MVSLYSILLSLCYFVGAYIGRKDIFSPRFIFNVFAWLKNIPYAVDYIRINNITDENIDSYFLFKFISFICVNVGAENGGYPPTQNGDIRSLFWLFSLMALQN